MLLVRLGASTVAAVSGHRITQRVVRASVVRGQARRGYRRYRVRSGSSELPSSGRPTGGTSAHSAGVKAADSLLAVCEVVLIALGQRMQPLQVGGHSLLAVIRCTVGGPVIGEIDCPRIDARPTPLRSPTTPIQHWVSNQMVRLVPPVKPGSTDRGGSVRSVGCAAAWRKAPARLRTRARVSERAGSGSTPRRPEVGQVRRVRGGVRELLSGRLEDNVGSDDHLGSQRRRSPSSLRVWARGSASKGELVRRGGEVCLVELGELGHGGRHVLVLVI
jgi:hypothetical protein